jgi:hypothetical protein
VEVWQFYIMSSTYVGEEGLETNLGVLERKSPSLEVAHRERRAVMVNPSNIARKDAIEDW